MRQFYALFLLLVISHTGWSQSIAVATAHPIGTQVARQVLEAGGNAYDAAVAAHFALAVVLPRAGNIGGGGFALIHTFGGEARALDFRETAPQAATRETFMVSGENIPPSSLRSIQASGVPGSVAGMWELYTAYRSGRFTWAELLQPAILLADTGFAMTPFLADLLLHTPHIAEQEGSPFYRQVPWQAGDRLTQHVLAQTLTDIAAMGPEGFYQGLHAARLVDWSQGWFTPEDIGLYRAVWRAPLSMVYRGYNLYTMPPPSSGGVALIQLLKGSDRPANRFGKRWKGEAIHDFTELAHRVYQDRTYYLGDPDYMEVVPGALMDDGYLANRFADIEQDRHVPIAWNQSHTELESNETTHFSILDSAGNAIAITTTLNGLFGSGLWVDGYFMNNEMDDFATQPGVPNQFGLIGYEVNSVAPGKRMLSSMTPTILVDGSGNKVVLGTPGGSTIITNVFQVVLHHVRYQKTLEEAVHIKKVHAQGLPEKLFYEVGALTPRWQKKLKALGHPLEAWKQIGRFQAVSSFEAVADVTRSGDSQGYFYSDGVKSKRK
ncbi:MAG: hypothetical protein ABR88_00600 [Cryomorphaceae bacterium BACL7 MAG-120322-bin74]|jgi:gamma-glutamyltranspeptidase / glutathione hydrolase|nr:MAG: hypothetical protein ABR88_00600 [Cryomorphaceae bacterium BACL7 MAG-120322-bin74]KRO83558.1 MAG: hypothetical protein ABR87_02045 [Cryomorphaceae bacterium BACL7 MAG-121220-bin83]NQW25434.1 gamma-glutamyltransferase [Cryomorphaceae bacterium]